MHYQKLIPINIFLIGSLLVFFLFYRYVYPKKQLVVSFVLLLVSIIPIISIFRTGGYESGDLNINVIKAMSLFAGLKEGILLPTWAGNLNATYGYPLFLFTYPLPYYIICCFHMLGFSFLTSTKLLLTFSYISSGLIMFYFLKKDYKEKNAFVGAIFYLFMPYHLIDLHFRVDIGEVLSFALMPLILLSFKKFLDKTRYKYFLGMIFSLSALLLSHQAVSLMFIGYFIFLLIFYLVKKEITLNIFLYSLSCVILSGLLCAFYLFPILLYERITHHYYTIQVTFTKFISLLYSPWRYGFLFQGHKGELSFLLGYTQLYIILFLIYLLVKRKIIFSQMNNLLFHLLIFFILLIMILPISKPLWYIIPLIKQFQFSYRLLALETFIISYLSAFATTYIKKKYFITIIIVLTIMPTILNWGNRATAFTVSDKTLAESLPLSTARGEGLNPAIPLWADQHHLWMAEIPPTHLQLLSGSGLTEQISRTSVSHEYNVFLRTPSAIKENTLYFPGWYILANGKPVVINYQNKKYPGIITFHLPPGIYHIVISYKKTTIEILGIILTIFIGMGLCLLLKKKGANWKLAKDLGKRS